MAREHGWPRHETNIVICGIEVDFAYPQWNLIFLADGYRFHANRVVAVTYDQLTRRRARTRQRLERIIRSAAWPPP